MKKTKVICIGEALIDRIRNKKNQEFTDFLGGAPANVAFALKKLNLDSVFIGCLGNDKFGHQFLEKFKELDVNIDFLQFDDKLPTRIVKVDRDQTGDRYFSGFVVSSCQLYADQALKKKIIEEDFDLLENLFSETKYFVIGTIMLCSQKSAESIFYLLEVAKNFDIKVVIDLNWREVFWDNSPFSSQSTKIERLNLIKNFLNSAHLLKMAKEEAVLFFESDNPFEISSNLLNRPDVIITDGGNPITWFINGFQGSTKVMHASQIIDTTGAGDAFLAGLISQLITFNHSLTLLDVQNCVQFASVCGLLTCLGEGAIDQQPSYKEVKQFLGSQI